MPKGSNMKMQSQHFLVITVQATEFRVLHHTKTLCSYISVPLLYQLKNNGACDHISSLYNYKLLSFVAQLQTGNFLWVRLCL